jgi:anti-anti-sigma factor
MVKLQQAQENGVTVLRFSGSLTQEEVERIEPEFVAAIDKPQPKIVVDLSKVDSMTTPGISMFVAALKSTARAGGRIVFTGTAGIVDDLLRRCRLDAIMTIVPKPNDAIDMARGVQH